MQRLLDGNTYEQTRKGLRALAVRLEAHPETEGFASPVRKKRKDMENKRELFEEGQAKRVAATARLTYLDQTVDGLAGTISRQVLLDTDNNRDDVRYQRLFPKTVSEMFEKVSGSEQAKFVGHLVNTIREHDGYKPLREFATKLEGAHGKLKAAEKKRDDLLVKESQLRTEFLLSLEDAKRSYNLMYPRLQLTFPDDLRLVETFFISFRSATKGEKGEES